MASKQEILRLLSGSTISERTKSMVLTMLPVMSAETEVKIFNALILEAQRNKNLDDKKRRIELKYEMMSQKLVKLGK